ncbi:hypothetical protein L0B53_01335 [Vibrio sp. SS-MA-C1-2]|uniref:hypothetical protein n=1 Tax=Vibrio sp. SS-MA-C1-2 TaxID=2908646 RepID=UPI001F34D9E9|nr:hypothetical protein [Vibrio sp. SS-MA-C1-2]UJF17443.1 hypothetical protein L0B53_01335 [Vibrio sp. SS-MA-C1-2]
MDANRSINTEKTIDITKEIRNANIVMKPDRLGAMHQNRISFVRSLTRKMAKEQWKVSQSEWQLSPQGYGHVIYKIMTPNHYYNLVIFCDQIEDHERNDRVIAEKWDVTFALVMGDVDINLLTQLQQNVPLQEAGRNPNNVLVLARANKSVRVFDHIIDQLANGQQPKAEELANVGYILRTTAVYGNGKFGIADFKLLEDNPDFNQSFSAQMCAVYLLRLFSLDWVHYLAKQKGGNNAITLDRGLQRFLGVGNATGLGMAPYLINHPNIIDQWMTTRERAVATVLASSVTKEKAYALKVFISKAKAHLTQTTTINAHQQQLNHSAVQELNQLQAELIHTALNASTWSDFILENNTLSLETQEIILSCLLEIYPEKVDQFSDQMNSDEAYSLPRGKKVNELVTLIQSRYQWAIETDYTLPENSYWFWYRSEDKEEPRLGVRGEELGEERELPLDIGRQTSHLYQALVNAPQTQSIADFLLNQPQYRTIVRRVWTLGNRVMGDIQSNVLHQNALPMHLLRCKLALFGATKFDPRSDRWVQVTFFQGAPLLDEIELDDWLFPLLPSHLNQNNNNGELSL